MQLWDERWARISILGDFQDGATAEVMELVSSPREEREGPGTSEAPSPKTSVVWC